MTRQKLLPLATPNDPWEVQPRSARKGRKGMDRRAPTGRKETVITHGDQLSMEKSPKCFQNT